MPARSNVRRATQRALSVGRGRDGGTGQTALLLRELPEKPRPQRQDPLIRQAAAPFAREPVRFAFA